MSCLPCLILYLPFGCPYLDKSPSVNNQKKPIVEIQARNAGNFCTKVAAEGLGFLRDPKAPHLERNAAGDLSTGQFEGQAIPMGRLHGMDVVGIQKGKKKHNGHVT